MLILLRMVVFLQPVVNNNLVGKNNKRKKKSDKKVFFPDIEKKKKKQSKNMDRKIQDDEDHYIKIITESRNSKIFTSNKEEKITGGGKKKKQQSTQQALRTSFVSEDGNPPAVCPCSSASNEIGKELLTTNNSTNTNGQHTSTHTNGKGGRKTAKSTKDGIYLQNGIYVMNGLQLHGHPINADSIKFDIKTKANSNGDVRPHLKSKYSDNMNLLFYDFNKQHNNEQIANQDEKCQNDEEGDNYENEKFEKEKYEDECKNTENNEEEFNNFGSFKNIDNSNLQFSNNNNSQKGIVHLNYNVNGNGFNGAHCESGNILNNNNNHNNHNHNPGATGATNQLSKELYHQLYNNNEIYTNQDLRPFLQKKTSFSSLNDPKKIIFMNKTSSSFYKSRLVCLIISAN